MTLSVSSFDALVQVTRSGACESLHLGAVAVMEGGGRLVAFAGDPQVPVFWRSTAKFHQALGLLSHPGAGDLDLGNDHVAVICASHHGQRFQVQRVEQVLARARAEVGALRCGCVEPLGRAALAELLKTGHRPSPLHHMCSGNHAGLLALAHLLGDPAPYDAPAAAVQVHLRALIARFFSCEPDQVPVGVDGCGIPTYRSSLASLAQAYARLALMPPSFPAAWRTSAARLFASVAEYPDMLSGPGEIDAEVCRAMEGTALCKIGAEALVAAAFAPSERWPQGLGIALKISDGTGDRARGVALLACLDQLEIGTAAQRDHLRARIPHVLSTSRGEAVGGLVPVFQLRRPPGEAKAG